MGLDLAEMFVRGKVEWKVELDKKHRLSFPYKKAHACEHS